MSLSIEPSDEFPGRGPVYTEKLKSMQTENDVNEIIRERNKRCPKAANKTRLDIMTIMNNFLVERLYFLKENDNNKYKQKAAKWKPLLNGSGKFEEACKTLSTQNVDINATDTFFENLVNIWAAEQQEMNSTDTSDGDSTPNEEGSNKRVNTPRVKITDRSDGHSTTSEEGSDGEENASDLSDSGSECGVVFEDENPLFLKPVNLKNSEKSPSRLRYTETGSVLSESDPETDPEKDPETDPETDPDSDPEWKKGY